MWVHYSVRVEVSDLFLEYLVFVHLLPELVKSWDSLVAPCAVRFHCPCF